MILSRSVAPPGPLERSGLAKGKQSHPSVSHGAGAGRTSGNCTPNAAPNSVRYDLVFPRLSVSDESGWSVSPASSGSGEYVTEINWLPHPTLNSVQCDSVYLRRSESDENGWSPVLFGAGVRMMLVSVSPGGSASPVASSMYVSPVNGLPKSAPKVIRYESVMSVESPGRSGPIEDGRYTTSVTVGFSADITPVDRSPAQTQEKIVSPPATSDRQGS